MEGLAEVPANRCQADGCMADLSGMRRYFRRYHVCETHIRAQVVLISGRQVRFCDQCSTFHPLQLFDGSRRTCREKLEHNRQKRRARKAKSSGAGGSAGYGGGGGGGGGAFGGGGGGGDQPSDDADSDDQPGSGGGSGGNGGGRQNGDDADTPLSPAFRSAMVAAAARKRQSAPSASALRLRQAAPRADTAIDVASAAARRGGPAGRSPSPGSDAETVLVEERQAFAARGRGRGAPPDAAGGRGGGPSAAVDSPLSQSQGALDVAGAFRRTVSLPVQLPAGPSPRALPYGVHPHEAARDQRVGPHAHGPAAPVFAMGDLLAPPPSAAAAAAAAAAAGQLRSLPVPSPPLPPRQAMAQQAQLMLLAQAQRAAQGQAACSSAELLPAAAPGDFFQSDRLWLHQQHLPYHHGPQHARLTRSSVPGFRMQAGSSSGTAPYMPFSASAAMYTDGSAASDVFTSSAGPHTLGEAPLGAAGGGLQPPPGLPLGGGAHALGGSAGTPQPRPDSLTGAREGIWQPISANRLAAAAAAAAAAGGSAAAPQQPLFARGLVSGPASATPITAAANAHPLRADDGLDAADPALAGAGRGTDATALVTWPWLLQGGVPWGAAAPGDAGGGGGEQGHAWLSAGSTLVSAAAAGGAAATLPLQQGAPPGGVAYGNAPSSSGALIQRGEFELAVLGARRTSAGSSVYTADERELACDMGHEATSGRAQAWQNLGGTLGGLREDEDTAAAMAMAAAEEEEELQLARSAAEASGPGWRTGAVAAAPSNGAGWGGAADAGAALGMLRAGDTRSAPQLPLPLQDGGGGVGWGGGGLQAASDGVNASPAAVTAARIAEYQRQQYHLLLLRRQQETALQAAQQQQQQLLLQLHQSPAAAAAVMHEERMARPPLHLHTHTGGYGLEPGLPTFGLPYGLGSLDGFLGAAATGHGNGHAADAMEVMEADLDRAIEQVAGNAWQPQQEGQANAVQNGVNCHQQHRQQQQQQQQRREYGSGAAAAQARAFAALQDRHEREQERHAFLERLRAPAASWDAMGGGGGVTPMDTSTPEADSGAAAELSGPALPSAFAAESQRAATPPGAEGRGCATASAEARGCGGDEEAEGEGDGGHGGLVDDEELLRQAYSAGLSGLDLQGGSDGAVEPGEEHDARPLGAHALLARGGGGAGAAAAAAGGGGGAEDEALAADDAAAAAAEQGEVVGDTSPSPMAGHDRMSPLHGPQHGAQCDSPPSYDSAAGDARAARAPAFGGGGGGGGGSEADVGASPRNLSQLIVKLSHARPEHLPTDLPERLESMLRGAGAAALGPTIREGCIELLVDVRHACPREQLAAHLFCLDAPHAGAGCQAASVLGPSGAFGAAAARAAAGQLRDVVGATAFDSCERVTMQLHGWPLVLSCRGPGSEPELLPWARAFLDEGAACAAAWKDSVRLLQPPVLVADAFLAPQLTLVGPPGFRGELAGSTVRLGAHMAGDGLPLGSVRLAPPPPALLPRPPPPPPLLAPRGAAHGLPVEAEVAPRPRALSPLGPSVGSSRLGEAGLLMGPPAAAALAPGPSALAAAPAAAAPPLPPPCPFSACMLDDDEEEEAAGSAAPAQLAAPAALGAPAAATGAEFGFPPVRAPPLPYGAARADPDSGHPLSVFMLAPQLSSQLSSQLSWRPSAQPAPQRVPLLAPLPAAASDAAAAPLPPRTSSRGLGLGLGLGLGVGLSPAPSQGAPSRAGRPPAPPRPGAPAQPPRPEARRSLSATAPAPPPLPPPPPAAAAEPPDEGVAAAAAVLVSLASGVSSISGDGSAPSCGGGPLPLLAHHLLSARSSACLTAASGSGASIAERLSTRSSVWSFTSAPSSSPPPLELLAGVGLAHALSRGAAALVGGGGPSPRAPASQDPAGSPFGGATARAALSASAAAAAQERGAGMGGGLAPGGGGPEEARLQLPLVPQPGVLLLDVAAGHLAAACWPVVVVKTAAQAQELSLLLRELMVAADMARWQTMLADLALVLSQQQQQQQPHGSGPDALCARPSGAAAAAAGGSGAHRSSPTQHWVTAEGGGAAAADAAEGAEGGDAGPPTWRSGGSASGASWGTGSLEHEEGGARRLASEGSGQLESQELSLTLGVAELADGLAGVRLPDAADSAPEVDVPAQLARDAAPAQARALGVPVPQSPRPVAEADAPRGAERVAACRAAAARLHEYFRTRSWPALAALVAHSDMP